MKINAKGDFVIHPPLYLRIYDFLPSFAIHRKDLAGFCNCSKRLVYFKKVARENRMITSFE
jgi:hypothetical protein